MKLLHSIIRYQLINPIKLVWVDKLGIELSGDCECGYKGQVYIASGRAQHGKVFQYPHYCDACSSLTTIDMLNETKACSECGSANIHSYEALTRTLPYSSIIAYLPISLLRFLGFHRANVMREEAYCYRLNKTFIFLQGDRFCPKCKENSMQFLTTVLYDWVFQAAKMLFADGESLEDRRER